MGDYDDILDEDYNEIHARDWAAWFESHDYYYNEFDDIDLSPKDEYIPGKDADNPDATDPDTGVELIYSKEQYKEDISACFLSPYPFLYVQDKDFELRFKPEGNEPSNKQILAIQSILEEYGAYQFVDQNLLGYLMRNNHFYFRVYFLMSTDKTVNGHSKDDAVVFVAIEWNSENERILVKEIGRIHLDKLVTIEDQQFQIIGAITTDEKTTPIIRNTFMKVKDAVYDDCIEAIKHEQEVEAHGGIKQSFIKSKKDSYIDFIFIGCSEKEYLDSDMNIHPVRFSDLYTLVKATREGLDYPYRFGCCTELSIKTISDNWNDYQWLIKPDMTLNRFNCRIDIEDHLTWISENYGHIVFYFPKPNGNEYPIRIIRKTVDEWLNHSSTDCNRCDMIKGIVDHSLKNPNGYIKLIVKELMLLLDYNDSSSRRKYAIKVLQEHLILNDGYFEIDSSGMTQLHISDNVYVFSSNEEVIDVFKILARHKVKFTIPQHLSFYKVKDVIEADIFKVRLNSLYNHDAKILIAPIDPNNNHIDYRYIYDPKFPDIKAVPMEFDIDGRIMKVYKFGRIFSNEKDYINISPFNSILNEVCNLKQGEASRENNLLWKVISDEWSDRVYHWYEEKVKLKIFDFQELKKYKEIYLLGWQDGTEYVYLGEGTEHPGRILPIRSLRDEIIKKLSEPPFFSKRIESAFVCCHFRGRHLTRKTEKMFEEMLRNAMREGRMKLSDDEILEYIHKFYRKGDSKRILAELKEILL